MTNFSDRERGDRGDMEARIQAEIDKLPSDERIAAQKEHDERKRFFEEMKDLTPEQRMAKFQDFMSQPENLDRMENSRNARDSRKSPQQRKSSAKKYLKRKAAAGK